MLNLTDEEARAIALDVKLTLERIEKDVGIEMRKLRQISEEKALAEACRSLKPAPKAGDKVRLFEALRYLFVRDR